MIKTRCLLVLCLFMLKANVLWATEGITRDFNFRYVHLSVTQNYASFREVRSLLFKGRAMLLNNVVSKKIAAGQLDDVKFDIQVYDPVISSPQLIIRRRSKRCEIILSGYPSIQRLRSLVTYASVHKDGLEYAGEGAEERIARFYTEYADQAALPASSLVVWSRSGLSLLYNADSLQYVFNSVPLHYQANGNLPLEVRGRFLLFTKDAINVIRQGAEIATVKIQSPVNADFDCNVYAGWVNICNGGPLNWYYSYAYEQNKFFKNPKYLQ